MLPGSDILPRQSCPFVRHFVFILTLFWVFLGWPQIRFDFLTTSFNFPPEVKEAQADTISRGPDSFSEDSSQTIGAAALDTENYTTTHPGNTSTYVPANEFYADDPTQNSGGPQYLIIVWDETGISGGTISSATLDLSGYVDGGFWANTTAGGFYSNITSNPSFEYSTDGGSTWITHSGGLNAIVASAGDVAYDKVDIDVSTDIQAIADNSQTSIQFRLGFDRNHGATGGPPARAFSIDHAFLDVTYTGGPPTTIFITSGTTWVVPSDWNNSDNTIEVIGGGGGGSAESNPIQNAGAGAGGGAYSKITNTTLTAGGTIGISVGSGGGGGTGTQSGTGGGDTYLCNSTSNCASISGTAVLVGAKGGAGGAGTSGGSGGAAASGVGTTKFSGGNGGNGGGDGFGGGGGGGAGGTTVAGSNGSNATSNELGGDGGAGGAASGGTGGTGGTGHGAAGGNGTVWDATHGAGGGGGAGAFADGSSSYNGGDGGNYGGGGGGSGGDSASAQSGGDGIQGLIVVTYTPAGGGGATATLENVAEAGDNGSVITVTHNFGWTATAGRLLVLSASWDRVVTNPVEFSGDWTRIDFVTSGNTSSGASGAMYYKVAVGDETSVRLDWGNSEDISIRVAEYSGIVTTNPLDRSSSAVSSGAVTFLSTGSTAATVQNNELAIAMMGSDTFDNTNTGRSWTEVTFTEDTYIGGAAGDPGLSVAHLDLTSTGTVATKFTTSGSGDEMVAIVATFKVSGGATFAAAEDAALGGLTKHTIKRLRIEVSNDGSATSGSVLYRLEVSEPNPPSSLCASATTWTRVDSSSEWNMAASTHFADADATQDVDDQDTNPGLTNGNTTFVAGESKDTTDETTAGITLTTSEFTEIEYALAATNQ